MIDCAVGIVTGVLLTRRHRSQHSKGVIVSMRFTASVQFARSWLITHLMMQEARSWRCLLDRSRGK